LTTIELLGAYGSVTTSLNMNGSGINYLDAPATTSSITYKTQMLSSTAGADMRAQWNGATSTITLLEIGA
jgi:hypothetical protein